MSSCGPFGIVAYIFTAWEQGYLGIIISVLALVVGIGLAIRFQWFKGFPIAIALALVLYFFPEAVAAIMGVNPDACQSSYRSAQIISDNLRACAPLVSSYSSTGEDCSCNGLQPTPVCTTYYAACEADIPGYQTADNYCSCSLSDTTSTAVPSCLAYPSTYQPSYSSSLQVDCTSVDTTWGESPYCTDTTPSGTPIPQDADWIGAVPNTYDPVNAHAYYTVQTQIDNTTGAPIAADWYGDADDVSWYFLNGEQVDYNPASNSWTTLQDTPVTLPVGVSTLDITVLNDDLGAPDTPNPSGVASELIASGGEVLTATNSSSWYQVSGPPTAPTPPPPTQITDCYTTSCAG